MHPWFMKRLPIAVAGGSALLLACVVHDETTSPMQPPPVPPETTPPTRFVVDSGVVTFSTDGAATTPGSGGVGANTPDGGAVPDSGLDLATPDLGGAGATCDVFAQNPCGADLRLGCYFNPATNTATCQAPGDRVLPTAANCTPGDSLCGPQLWCLGGFCTGLCHFGQASATECNGGAGSACSTKLGTSNIGVCQSF
jgi:hypothetical protein